MKIFSLHTLVSLACILAQHTPGIRPCQICLNAVQSRLSTSVAQGNNLSQVSPTDVVVCHCHCQSGPCELI